MSRLLFLSRWFPYPPNNGSKLRIFNLLRGLSEEHDVTLLTFADRPGAALDRSGLASICQDVHVVPWKPYQPDSLQARLGFLSPKPRSVIDTFSPEMEARIEQCLAEGHVDAVIASQIDMAAYAPAFDHLPALFEEVEVGGLYEQFAMAPSPWNRMRYALTWAKHRRFLAGLLRRFEACTVVSERERQLLLQEVAPGFESVELIPNCIHLDDYTHVHTLPEPNTLIFTGAFTYHANYEAMVWFLEEVYPRVKAGVPEVRLIITGDHADLPLPPAPDVTLTGFVDDVHSLIAGSWISLAPIREGGGTRLKILEAMALRTPVVSTSKGAEGLAAQDGEQLLLADTPEAFADAVIHLLQEPGWRTRLADNAFQLVRERYHWPVVMPRFLRLVRGLG